MKSSFLPICLFAFLCLLPISLLAHPGIGIVMDSKGNIFYTDLTHVWRISPAGILSIAVEDVHTHELYLDEEDNLYGEHVWYKGEASDEWAFYTWCFGNDGELHQTPPTTGFPLNNTLTRDAEGSTYWQEKVGDQEIIKKETANGQISQLSPYQFQDIRWMYIPQEGMDVYVIDHLSLKKVSANGQVQLISDQLPETNFLHDSVRAHHHLMGIWSDIQQNIYVAIYGGRKVKKISPKGKIDTVLVSPKDWSPSGGLVAPDSSLWILEYSVRNKVRVRQLKQDGQELIFH